MRELRATAVAGHFYPENPEELRDEIQKLTTQTVPPKMCLGLMVPHAGYLYSGALAGAAYSQTIVPDRVIILCPNHTGLGSPVSIWDRGQWETPLGRISIDEPMAHQLTSALGISGDDQAHLDEHAIEVQLPFLQRLNPEFQLTPIVLGNLSLKQCHELASILAHAISASQANYLIIASTDMSHFIPATEAKKWDSLALNAVSRGDFRGLYETVTRNQITMCGYVPTTITIDACKQISDCEIQVLGYQTSAAVNHDESNVVGYAAAQIFAKHSS